MLDEMEVGADDLYGGGDTMIENVFMADNWYFYGNLGGLGF